MINIENLSKIYGTKEATLYAVKNAFLEVQAGEFLMIMGRSGCGKSTLLNIIGCIDGYDGGTYSFENLIIKSLKLDQLAKLRREKIGYIYQAYNLIDELTCLDNIEISMGYAGISGKERRTRAKAQLERVGLPEKANAYPQQLSGGQQQRVAVARALSNQPSLILADEPTGNLDYQTGIQIMELLKELNKEGITIVMVTHDQELTAYASRVIHMQDGEFLD